MTGRAARSRLCLILACLLGLAMALAACTPRRSTNRGDDDDSGGDDDTGDDDTGDDDTGDDDDSTPSGDPVSDELLLIDRVFELDLAGATFVEPPGIGGLLGGLLADSPLLISVLDDPPSDFGVGALHVRIGTGEVSGGWVDQDWCTATNDVTAGSDGVLGTGDDDPADWDDPTLVVGPTTLMLDVQGATTSLSGLVISTTFGFQVTSFDQGLFEGTVDTRGLDPLLGSGPGGTCDLIVQTVGVPCIPCSDGQPFCLFMQAVDMTGQSIGDFGLVQRSAADVAADPNCN